MMYLIPMEINNQRIMTTKVLAEQFGTEERRITENFKRNEERFVQGKHYLLLEGEILREFKRDYAERVPVNVNKLYLWTDRGAARHAKILDTDEAWDVYEALEDTYFKVINNQIESNKQPIGIVESLHLELNNAKQEIEELKKIVFAGERKAIAKIKKKGILTPTDIELEFVSDSDILEIVSVALETGFLREEYRGTAISLKSMHDEASKKNIKKTILNKKLLLMDLVVPDKKNYAGNQIRYNEQPTRCYIIKKEKI